MKLNMKPNIKLLPTFTAFILSKREQAFSYFVAMLLTRFAQGSSSPFKGLYKLLNVTTMKSLIIDLPAVVIVILTRSH